MNAQPDSYGDQYRESLEKAVAFAGRAHDFYIRVKVEHLLRLLRHHVGATARLRLLDLGCGIGLADSLLAPAVGALAAVDVSSAALRTARRENPAVSYVAADGARLPFADEDFDAVLAMNVFHHVAPARRQSVLGEMARVCRSAGLVVVFEHNPVHPLTRRVVRSCRCDRDAALVARRELTALFESARLSPVEARFILMLPVGGRIVACVERTLAQLPLGTQYYVAGAKRAW